MTTDFFYFFYLSFFVSVLLSGHVERFSLPYAIFLGFLGLGFWQTSLLCISRWSVAVAVGVGDR